MKNAHNVNKYKLIYSLITIAAGWIVGALVFIVIAFVSNGGDNQFNDASYLANIFTGAAMVVNILFYIIYWKGATTAKKSTVIWIILASFICIGAAIVGGILYNKSNSLVIIASMVEGVFLMAANIVAYVKFKVGI